MSVLVPQRPLTPYLFYDRLNTKVTSYFVEVADTVAVFYEGRTVDRIPAAVFRGDGSELQHPYTKALYHALPQNSFTVYSAQDVRQMMEAGGA